MTQQTEPEWTYIQTRPVSNPRTQEEIDRDIDAERARGLEEVQFWRSRGKPGRALYELARSVERQARIAGAGSWTLRPPVILQDVPREPAVEPPVVAVEPSGRAEPTHRAPDAAERLLGKLLGPKCGLGCGQRVFPADAAWHHELHHAEGVPR